MRLVASSGVWPSFQPVYDTPLRKMGFFPHPARGVEGVFSPEQVTQLIGVLDDIRTRAIV